MTLIELMIVILILGILAAIVILGIGAFQDTGNKEACQTSSRSVESAAAAYYAKNNQTWPDVSTLVSAGYIKAAPKASWNIAVNTGTGAVTDSC